MSGCWVTWNHLPIVRLYPSQCFAELARRPLLAAAVAAAAAVLKTGGPERGRGVCACASAPDGVVPLASRAAAPETTAAKPTVVLIHGLDSWSGKGGLSDLLEWRDSGLVRHLARAYG